MRPLYQCLLLMHPPAFRRRFAAEMLSIFDEAAQSTGALALFCDGFISLARQWMLRSGSWKLAVAVVGACIEVTAGGLMWLVLGHPQASAIVADGGFHGTVSALDIAGMGTLMKLILGSAGAIVLMVAAVSLWMRSFMRTRLALSPGCGKRAN